MAAPVLNMAVVQQAQIEFNDSFGRRDLEGMSAARDKIVTMTKNFREDGSVLHAPIITMMNKIINISKR